MALPKVYHQLAVRRSVGPDPAHAHGFHFFPKHRGNPPGFLLRTMYGKADQFADSGFHVFRDLGASQLHLLLEKPDTVVKKPSQEIRRRFHRLR